MSLRTAYNLIRVRVIKASCWHTLCSFYLLNVSPQHLTQRLSKNIFAPLNAWRGMHWNNQWIACDYTGAFRFEVSPYGIVATAQTNASKNQKDIHDHINETVLNKIFTRFLLKSGNHMKGEFYILLLCWTSEKSGWVEIHTSESSSICTLFQYIYTEKLLEKF